MLTIKIHEQACRGCQMCVDICPTKVFEFDNAEYKCLVKYQEDCLACLSCTYVCPSGAIVHEGHHIVKNFYRDHAFTGRMEKFL